ncbi:hypothetical protein B0H34DRAFT_674423 [Crassisporium funariophilum]|nr:hypothetical protein B0H34DRAFT_674423 [Crassisporium funariophilum]
MSSARGSGDKEINILDLGPLHKKVKAHCIKIIDNPTLLLAANTSHTAGTLDGKLWQRPEAFYAVHQMAPTLPHLELCLVALYRGALKTWNWFTSKFEEDGAIHGLSNAAKCRIHMSATNNHNEGALGSLRVAMQAAPNLSLQKFNSKMMYKKNGTHTFVDAECTPADKKFI